MQEKVIDVNNFDDIRPYRDDEIGEVLSRILAEPVLYKILKYIYPGLGNLVIQKMFKEIKTVEQFQSEVSGPAFKVIAQTTSAGLSFTNMESIDRDKAYVFLSNHRDIILDSALLNVSLMEKGYNTTQIAIGDNLLQLPVVHDLVRINKNFIVNRNISQKEVYPYSLRLSNYIRSTIRNGDSIWIAQREGRSKDGDDRTATGLLKMLALSGQGEIENSLLEINIIPMAVSYEYDPCDILKAYELLHLKYYGSYEKKPGEDFKSMLRGITGHKGRVNIAFGTALDDTINQLRFIQNKNEKYKQLTQSIDAEMHRIFKLWPTNYIAFDLLNGSREFKDQYSNIQKIAFHNYIRANVIKLGMLRRKSGLPKENFTKNSRETLLKMYAKPVENNRIYLSELFQESLGR
ncbi:MAG: 1-acyl-sn-glycerol-3-phosphate acyltransferase [Flavobacteriales bacterium]|nr:1-acyl-sn-glycerol-3-phosphate acyltransferase [Flavobacteriales bacterium]